MRIALGTLFVSILIAGFTWAEPWTDNRCESCHETNGLFSHPIDVVPSMRIPESFPLEDGRMTCATCHDNSEASLHVQARGNHQPMLRNYRSGRSFCTQCHDATETGRSSKHGAILGKAHLAWPNKKSGLASSTGRLRDDLTQICMSCHDGAVSSDISMDVGNSFNQNGSTEHPVRSLYLSTNGTVLRASATLDQRVNLFEGRIGCNSCHSLYSKEKSLLVMSNTGSKLCLSCHQM